MYLSVRGDDRVTIHIIELKEISSFEIEYLKALLY